MFNLEANGDPIYEAVTLAEVKAHARIFTSADDAYISGLLVSAREQVEKDLQMAVVGQAYKLHLDYWYDCHLASWFDRYGFGWCRHPNSFYPKIVLPIQPVLSVESITYIDPTLASQTLNASLYVLKTFKDPPHIMLLNGGSMPATAPYSDIVVHFTTGYATETPNLIKHAVLFLAANWYENRESSTPQNLRDLPQGYERIINRLRVKRLV